MQISRAKEYRHLVDAAAEGKTLQATKLSNGVDTGWEDIGGSDELYMEPHRYRVKPEAKLRPWLATEVPVGALARTLPFIPSKVVALITGTIGEDIVVLGHTENEYSARQLANEWEHSMDGGQTWLPCGVEE